MWFANVALLFRMKTMLGVLQTPHGEEGAVVWHWSAEHQVEVRNENISQPVVALRAMVASFSWRRDDSRSTASWIGITD